MRKRDKRSKTVLAVPFIIMELFENCDSYRSNGQMNPGPDREEVRNGL
jgi:hypothetical protein